MKVKNKTHVNIADKIYAIIKNDVKRWHSIDEIASLIGIRAGDVHRVINESYKFVLSYDDKSRPIITTRDRFRKEEPFIRKLIGAFSNRMV